MVNFQELFLLQLAQMYDIEQNMVQVWPQFAQETQDYQAQQAFLKHEQETRQHVRNLKQCFELLGSQPIMIENHTVSGLKKDHDAFAQQQPAQKILTLFDLGVGRQIDYLEMASYQSLFEIAQMFGNQQCALLLQENLQQKMDAAQDMASLAYRMTQQSAPV